MGKDPGWESFKSVSSGPKGGAGGKHTRAAKGGKAGCLELVIPAIALVGTLGAVVVEVIGA